MKKVVFVVALLCIVVVTKAQVLLTQGFELSTFPPTGWTHIAAPSGNPPAQWSRIGNGANPSNTPRSGLAQARLNAYDANGGTASLITPALNFAVTGVIEVSFWMWRENSFAVAAYAAEGVTVQVNTSASATGATTLGYIPRVRNFAPSVPADGWYRYKFTIPASFNGTSNYILFNGTSRWGSNFYIDEIEVTRIPPCTGIPAAGAAFASADSICAATPLVLNDTTIAQVAGLSYQWQSAPAGSGNWSNIPGATTTAYTISAGISSATDFRLAVSCAASAQTGHSVPVSVGVKAFYNCYCNSTSNLSEDNIGQVSFATGFANPAAAPSPLTANTTATAKYSDFTGLGPIDVVPGGAIPFELTQINRNSYWTCGLAVFADFNHNSSFSDPGELVYGPIAGPATAAAAPTFTGALNIPATAFPGITRLRFVLVERSVSISPCGAYNYGETEDYLIRVVDPTPPAPVLSSNGPICEGQPLQITASIPVSYPNPVYSLSHPSLGTVTSSTGVFSIPAAACANGGTYSVSVSSQGLTGPAATLNVVVNCVPTIAIAAPTGPSGCILSDGHFSVAGLTPAVTYTLSYRKNGTAVSGVAITADASGTARIGGLAAGTYDQMVVQTAAGCISNTVSAVTVIPTPTNPPTPVLSATPTPICSGANVGVVITNAAAGATYQWTGPGSFTDTGRVINIAGFAPARDGVYSVQSTVNGCISNPGTITLQTRAATPKPLRNNITYCQYDTPVPMTATTVTGNLVEWFDTCSSGAGCVLGLRPRGSSIASPNAPVPNTSIPGTVMWIVRQTETNGCPSDYDSVYARILPKPALPVPPAATVEYCQYQNAGALTVSGANVKWFTTLTGGSGTTVAPVPGTTVPGTYHFYASQTTADGCEGDRVMITVVVKPKPQPPVVASPLNLCQGDAPKALTAIGQSLLWYTIPNGGAGVGVSPEISTAYEDSFAHYVTQTINGCESDRALLRSYVNYKPNGVITGSSASVCQDGVDTFSYFGNGRPDAEYNWFAPLSTEFVSGSAQAGPVAIRFDTAGTSTVQLIVNNRGCISKLLSAPITVRPLPQISFVNRQDVCADELVNVALRAIEPGITSYQWDFGPDATIVYGELQTGGPFGVRFPRPGHYAVSAAATKAGCTSKPVLQDIFVHERPQTSISYLYRNGTPLDQFCASDTLLLSVPAAPEGGTYAWSPAAYFQSREDSLDNEVKAVVSRSSHVHVRVRNAFGCEASDSLYVPAKPCCGVFFPNAFTPNSQVEQNRIFRPITTGMHRINNFRVMNRWGQVMWESTAERAGWDGTFRGVPQDMGTYFFYINYRCGDKNIEDKGEVVLIR